MDSIVVSVTVIKGGTAHNVIPDEVELIGTLRALTVRTLDYGVQRIQEMAASVGSVFRCNVTVGWDSALLRTFLLAASVRSAWPNTGA